ncbi:YciI family protein [Actimicrobium sp. CCI2.3]|uniref:YciI family protein n=1 Tax=Actimicrobium sp. CCI2.3 TaxID=3048616 RepID=UPI002AB58F90|nr:YciI family protein [Actimicrobium sp. CCI2.3]MDY7574412.1 YciI family protein [Actimicrobium sp. CCI2.3]MEB0022510.1 YciI family protein [Actimicrobium sp. CCI2.3]
MRVIVMIKASTESEAGILPSTSLLAAMGAFNQELVNAGVMLAGEGLHPSSKGARVAFGKDGPQVIHGPFADTKELIAGFWLWEVRSMDEAIDWIRRMPQADGMEQDIEIRPLFEMNDFGEALTPELRAQEERLRAASGDHPSR